MRMFLNAVQYAYWYIITCLLITCLPMATANHHDLWPLSSAQVLQSFQIMDYSLLVGVYNIEQAKREQQNRRSTKNATTGAGGDGVGVAGEAGAGAASAPASVVHARHVSKSITAHNQNAAALMAAQPTASASANGAHPRRGSADAALHTAEQSNTSSSRTVTSPSSPLRGGPLICSNNLIHLLCIISSVGMFMCWTCELLISEHWTCVLTRTCSTVAREAGLGSAERWGWRRSHATIRRALPAEQAAPVKRCAPPRRTIHLATRGYLAPGDSRRPRRLRKHRSPYSVCALLLFLNKSGSWRLKS